MSTHDEIEELADLATAGAWTPDAHATSCASCTAAIADARAFHAWAVGLVAVDAPPLDLEERLIKAFRATGTEAARRFRLLPGKRFLKWTAGAAAAVGLVLLGGAFAGPDDLRLKNLASVEADFRGNDTVDNFPDGAMAVDGRRVPLGSPTAGGAGPLTGAKFSLDEPSGGHAYGFTTNESARLGAEDGRRLHRYWFTTQDQYARDVEQLKQYNEALERDGAGRADEYRGRLGKVLAEKSTAAAELQVARQQSDRLSQDLAKLEEKHVDLFRDRKFLEEKINAVNQAASAPSGDDADKAAVVRRLGAQRDPEPAAAAQDVRKIIRTARLAMEVEAYETAQTKIAASAAEEKGFVATADTERLQNGKIRATVTLRVPPDRFEALLAKLRALGTVKHQSLGSQDVTRTFVDLEARLGAKQALLDRLKKVLAEAKGSVKELMEVEVQMGATLEQIEAIKGELKFLGNQVDLATITLELAEKDLGQPFEYVQTLQSRIGLVTPDVDAAYAAAQKTVLDAGGQVVDSKMTRQNDGAATGTIKARVEASKFPDVRQALRALGHVETDTVDQQKTARGGQPTAAAPVRVEQATIDLSVATPALLITRRAQLGVEAKDVEGAYVAARKAVEGAGGRILDGGLSKRTDGGAASLKVQVDVAKFAELVDIFKASGVAKHAVVNQSAGALPGPVRERAEIELVLQSPPPLVGEEHGIGRTVRETFGRSWAGLLWSIEKLFVGLSLAGPWALAGVAAWLVWRRTRRPKAPAAQ
jgi:DNA-binding FrmR family transcriptional regulator